MFVTIARLASAHGSEMYSCFASRRRAPSSSSCGLFVAPTSSNRPVNNSQSICPSFENKKISRTVVAAEAVHLDQELRLHPPRALVLPIRLARAQQRVDLVDEYHRRLAAPRHREQRADHLLALADPLTRQTRCGDAVNKNTTSFNCPYEYKNKINAPEKRRAALTRHGPSDQSLTSPRRPEQE